MQRKRGLDTSKGIEVKPLCNSEVTKITSSKAALSRPFNVVDLTPSLKQHLHIKSYVDYYGGYAEVGRQVILRLHDYGKFIIKLTSIKTPVDIDPIVWDQMNWFIHNPAFNIEQSKHLIIAGPGHLQKHFLPNDRQIIGWTMVESLECHPDMIPWLQNAHVLLCPTNIDVKRFNKAGLKNTVKMHHGFDDKLYNPQVKPLDIPQLRNRYVFGVLGSWNCRKGIKEIIHAFCKTFKKTDDVSLLLCCKYGTRPYNCSVTGRTKEDDNRWNIEWEFEQYLNEIGMTKNEAPHITLLDIPVHDTVVPHLMARFNCMVGFSAGESTWLPGLQAMAMKIPIIQLAAEVNGFMEYLEDVAVLCEEVEYVEANEELYLGTSEYYEDQYFAKGNVEELAMKMELVYKSTGELNNRLNLGVLKSKDWTWQVAIKALASYLLD